MEVVAPRKMVGRTADRLMVRVLGGSELGIRNLLHLLWCKIDHVTLHADEMKPSYSTVRVGCRVYEVGVRCRETSSPGSTLMEVVAPRKMVGRTVDRLGGVGGWELGGGGRG